MSRRVVSAIVCAIAALSLLIAVPATAQAAFSGVATASTSVGTATMVTPGSFSASLTCRLLSPSQVTLNWAGTPDRLTDGYTITVTNGAQVQTFAVAEGSTNQVLTVPNNGVRYTFTVRSRLGGWTSQVSAGMVRGCSVLAGPLS